MLDDPHRAWNNFVTLSDPASCAPNSSYRAAAIANRFWGSANNGGLNSFLTGSYDFDAEEVREALEAVGACGAARQLGSVLDGLGTPLRQSSQDERWDLLDKYWADSLEEFDTLSGDVDVEIATALERHVRDNEAHYLALGDIKG